MSNITPYPPHLGAEFLLWLWMCAETEGQVVTRVGKIQVWVEDRLVFRCTNDEKPTVVLTASETASAESKAALHSGKVLAEARFGFKRDERDYKVTLMADLGPRNLEMPQVMSERADEALLDRMFLYDEFISILRGAFDQYAKLRHDTKRFALTVSSWAL